MLDINYLEDEVLDSVSKALGMEIDWQADDADEKLKLLQEKIATLEPIQVFRLYLQWHGIIGPSWTRNIVGAIESIKSACNNGERVVLF
jgi:hypothetical protein